VDALGGVAFAVAVFDVSSMHPDKKINNYNCFLVSVVGGWSVFHLLGGLI
jgi:hypothetical protein